MVDRHQNEKTKKSYEYSMQAYRQTVRLILLISAQTLHGEIPSLSVSPDLNSKTLSISGQGNPAASHRIEHSRNLNEWWPIFAIRDSPSWSWDWDKTKEAPASQFRLVDVSPPVIAPHASWKNQIALPSDPFLSDPVVGTGERFDPVEIRWVKFAMIIDGLPEVYFQRSSDYQFHFQFAAERLSPFSGMDSDTFNNVSLYHGGQKIVLGAVLWAPDHNEFGIQFVGQDTYPREMLHFLYDTVVDRIAKPAGCEGFYMPTYEQAEAAQEEQPYLVAHGIEVSSPERWIGGSVCYAEGWALGRLVFVEPKEIENAYTEGTLLPTDILLTTGIPAELPFVAGIITLAPTTPNSHVAILAQSYGIPFVYLREPNEQVSALNMAGNEIVLRTRGYNCTIDVFDVDGIETAYRDEIVALKAPLPLSITPTKNYGAIAIASLDDVLREDIRFIGGKAANFGFLRREIPKNSPNAIAFTFDLWNEYLNQMLSGGKTLRTEIADRLARLSWPTDIATLDSTLREIRNLIKVDADFSATQKSAILSELSGFDPTRKIRFRSSTNVEDSGVFVGAGLYDSFSGCLADDTDDDSKGPSHCDPDQPKERGVFRAMRKVYAGFYNLNAVIERLRHGIEESGVGMAILVHHSYPDEIEAANGVATSRTSGANYLYTDMVSQVDAESVTNPSGGSQPEIMELFRPRSWAQNSLTHRQRSNRLLLGIDTVMEWEDDYQYFGNMFLNLNDAFKAQSAELGETTLEFEYKKLTDGKLIIKQLRQVPEAEGRPAAGIALVNTPTSLKIFQGESGSLFGNHRLKSLWKVESDNRWTDPTKPGGNMMTAAELQHAPRGNVINRTGSPAIWPGARHDTLDLNGQIYSQDLWNWPSDGGNTTFELRMKMPTGTGYQLDPVYTTGDFRIEFWAKYSIALPNINWQGNRPTTSEFALLIPGSITDPLPDGAILKTREFSAKGGIEIDSSFYWPPHPTGPTAGYTAPLEKWVGTTIKGLTPNPINLTSYFSQTYRPGHHNFTEDFLFEPGLDLGVSKAIISALQAKNIRMIFCSFPGGPGSIKAVGFDGSIWDL